MNLHWFPARNFSRNSLKKNTTGHASATHFDHLQLLLASVIGASIFLTASSQMQGFLQQLIASTGAALLNHFSVLHLVTDH